MNQSDIKAFFAIIRSAIDGKKLNSQELKEYSKEMLPNMLKLSAQHDVSHLLVVGLKQNGLIEKDNNDINKFVLKPIYLYEKLRYEYNRICEVFEKEQIPYIPLKGAIIRKHYPEEWMRTSCDIDILVAESDLDKAKSLLIEKCAYKYHIKGSHDLSFATPTNVHVELHYSLVEDGRAKEASKVLKGVWNNASVCKGYNYRYQMPDEFFYFYHIAHMAKHFEDGGCGIRTFIDLWILDNLKEANLEKRNQLLTEGELLKFAQVVKKLCRVWFENEEHDLISKQTEDYILRGGIYGNSQNRIAIQQQKSGGRLKYALSKIFIPYEVIKFHYPVLQKHKWLTPFMQVRRWFKLIFCGHAKRTFNQLKYNQSISPEVAEQTKKYLQDIGL